jgi:hypothetical protein
MPAAIRLVNPDWMTPKTKLANYKAFAVQHQNSIGATVDEEQSSIDAEPARINYPSVLAEWPQQLSMLIEREQFAIARTVRT